MAARVIAGTFQQVEPWPGGPFALSSEPGAEAGEAICNLALVPADGMVCKDRSSGLSYRAGSYLQAKPGNPAIGIEIEP